MPLMLLVVSPFDALVYRSKIHKDVMTSSTSTLPYVPEELRNILELLKHVDGRLFSELPPSFTELIILAVTDEPTAGHGHSACLVGESFPALCRLF